MSLDISSFDPKEIVEKRIAFYCKKLNDSRTLWENALKKNNLFDICKYADIVNFDIPSTLDACLSDLQKRDILDLNDFDVSVQKTLNSVNGLKKYFFELPKSSSQPVVEPTIMALEPIVSISIVSKDKKKPSGKTRDLIRGWLSHMRDGGKKKFSRWGKDQGIETVNGIVKSILFNKENPYGLSDKEVKDFRQYYGPYRINKKK